MYIVNYLQLISKLLFYLFLVFLLHFSLNKVSLELLRK